MAIFRCRTATVEVHLEFKRELVKTQANHGAEPSPLSQMQNRVMLAIRPLWNVLMELWSRSGTKFWRVLLWLNFDRRVGSGRTDEFMRIAIFSKRFSTE